MAGAHLIVKICGIRTLADAQAAIDAGADMLGFNFYPKSPRAVTPQTCREILAQLRPARPLVFVGVFVNFSPAVGASAISAVLDATGLHLAQLSGDEPAPVLEALGERAFKALRIRPGESIHAAFQGLPPRSRPPALLLDAYRPGEYGGTGAHADWGQA